LTTERNEFKAEFVAVKRTTLMLLSSLIAATPLASGAQPTGASINEPAPATRDVEFRSGDITLSGTLVMPSHMVAAIVWVDGAGQSRRDVPSALALARDGVGILTYDKRGVGKSGGVYAGPEVGTNNVDPGNLDLLAADVSAAVTKLRHEISSPRKPVGLLGVSQAGWIIPLAAVRNREVKFMILWSGPAVTTIEQLRFQFLTNGRADFWDHHSEAEVRDHIRSDPDRYVFVATDPVDSLQNLSIPGLWLYGGRDVNVPVSLSIERLKALAASRKPFEHGLFPESGHRLPFDEAWSTSLDWLMKTVIQR
jgi:pimeloyl-ACP methyl ester carboxylesterase